MKRKVLVLILILILSLSLTVSGEVNKLNKYTFHGWEGADIYPINDITLIRLERSRLSIYIQNPIYRVGEWCNQLPEEARVEAVYVLKNIGEAATIIIGCPDAAIYSEYGDQYPLIPAIRDLKVAVDKTAIRTKLQTAEKVNQGYNFSRVYLWRVRFAKNQTHIIQLKYRIKRTIGSPFTGYVNYVLSMAALWNGTVGKTDICIKTPVPVLGLKFVPYPEEYSEFHAENWEPTGVVDISSLTYEDELIFGKGKVSHFYPPAEWAPRFQEAAAQRQTLIREYIHGLTSQKLSRCNKKEIQIYINGVYATYGRPFKTKEWKKFFDAKWWYIMNSDYSDSKLSVEDKETIKRLSAYL